MQQGALSNASGAHGSNYPSHEEIKRIIGLILLNRGELRGVVSAAAPANPALPAANINVHLSATTLGQSVSLLQEISQQRIAL